MMRIWDVKTELLQAAAFQQVDGGPYSYSHPLTRIRATHISDMLVPVMYKRETKYLKYKIVL